nr:MAG TPA: hypothetical protein [Caudoviricetes sp.]
MYFGETNTMFYINLSGLEFLEGIELHQFAF